MRLQAIEINKRFIPEFNGNSELPAGDQVVIHFSRIPGTSERPTYRSFRFGQDGSVEMVFNDNMLCSAFVSKIENLEIGDEKIKTGRDLAISTHPRLSDLLTEIRNYLFPDDEELSEGESKA